MNEKDVKVALILSRCGCAWALTGEPGGDPFWAWQIHLVVAFVFVLVIESAVRRWLL